MSAMQPRDPAWEARVREECEAVRDACGVLDLPGFSRFRIQGAGAEPGDVPPAVGDWEH